MIKISFSVSHVMAGMIYLSLFGQALAQQSGTGLDIRAQLQPRQYTTIAAEIGLKVDELPFQESARFAIGDRLVVFECSMQQALLKKAQAELDGALAIAKSNKRLAKLNSIGELELAQSEANARKAAAEVSAQEAVIAKCTVEAPFDGRIAEQFVRQQQYVQPGQQLLDIIDDSVLELVFLVPSRWLQSIKVGDSFSVEIDETQKTYPAKFVRIGARVDPVSQSLKVVAEIDGAFPELLSGMSGRIVVDDTTRQVK
jgi:membrane fusion protein, multidrug efflux system